MQRGNKRCEFFLIDVLQLVDKENNCGTFLFCCVFFPVSQLPEVVQSVSAWLPLTHAIDLVRPLVTGNVPDAIGLHVAALLIYGSLGYVIALALTRQRLLK